ncbi:MAG: glutaredoxin family protein [Cyanobium sp.]
MGPFLLYSRQGCCLCEGLEERLLELLPPGQLQVVDVDEDPSLQARYGLSVPVLARICPGKEGGVAPAITPLPPVPPRLRGQGLQAWLQRHES